MGSEVDDLGLLQVAFLELLMAEILFRGARLTPLGAEGLENFSWSWLSSCRTLSLPGRGIDIYRRLDYRSERQCYNFSGDFSREPGMEKREQRKTI
ncbi:MAG: hypothetical protein WAU81_14265 [Candidatus Aminicenantales bacterium]